MATEIVSALDDVAGTKVERTETQPATRREATVAPNTFFGSHLGWSLAENMFSFFTNCSVGRTEEDLSRAISDEPASSTELRSILPDQKALPVVVEEECDSLWGGRGDSSSAQQGDPQEALADKLDRVNETRRTFSSENSDTQDTNPDEADTSKLDRMAEIRRTLSNESSQRTSASEFEGIRQQGSFTISPPITRGSSRI